MSRDQVIAGLVESTLKFGHPRDLWEQESGISAQPSPLAMKIRAKAKAIESKKLKIRAQKEKWKREREAEKQRRLNRPYLPRREAEKLAKSGDFMENLRKKAKWIERTLGVNLELHEQELDKESDFWSSSDSDATDDDFDKDSIENDLDDIMDEKGDSDQKGDDDDDEEDVAGGGGGVKQSKQKEVIPLLSRLLTRKSFGKRVAKKAHKKYLRFRRKFTSSALSGRPIGNIDFSTSNTDWFAATYLAAKNRYSAESNGLISIWNFMLPKFPEYSLTAQNQITSTHFHPTDPFFIFGTTLNGQILMWDLRNNKSKPMQRSNFSEGHSAPVFSMSFLPNIKQKQAEIAKQKGLGSKQNKPVGQDGGADVHHILSVSNDGKLCIWRTDQLSVKPQNVVDAAKGMLC